ncbi:placenta-expressed transcript 1 protein [Octodon degus]|uniref:Placenta-expressed transcript 1 protein n=1 Tax=Octodon degus TaxID=10160 RepID=A0A6P3V8C1_OCTDE|nr:placenta-expressed transcript 1 protein [Octodon degus]
MAGLRSVFLPLGLFLYLKLHLSSANFTNYSNNCTVFDKVFTTKIPGIEVKTEDFQGNTIYTIWVPVRDNFSMVLLQLVDKDNNSVGLCQGDEDCNGSALYHLTSAKDTFLKANCVLNSKDTADRLNIFLIDLNNSAVFVSQNLTRKVTTTTSTTRTSTNNLSTTVTMATTMSTAQTKTSTQTENTALTETSTQTENTSQTKTTAQTQNTAQIKTTAQTHNIAHTKTTAQTKTSTQNLAVRAFSSPIAGAIHILLVLLTSKLLF